MSVHTWWNATDNVCATDVCVEVCVCVCVCFRRVCADVCASDDIQYTRVEMTTFVLLTLSLWGMSAHEVT